MSVYGGGRLPGLEPTVRAVCSRFPPPSQPPTVSRPATRGENKNMTDPSLPGEWLTLREASERVGRSVRVVRAAVRAGEIAYRRGEARTAPYFVAVDSLEARFPPDTAPPSAAIVLLSEFQTRERELQVRIEDLTARAARAEGVSEAMRERIRAVRDDQERVQAEVDKVREQLEKARRWERAGWRERRRLRRGT